MTGLEPARSDWKSDVPPSTLHMHADKRSAWFLLSYNIFKLPHRCGLDRGGNDPPCKDFQSFANPSQLPILATYKRTASKEFISSQRS